MALKEDQVTINPYSQKAIQVVCRDCTGGGTSRYLIILQKAASVELLRFCIVCGKRAVFYNAEENH